MTLDNRTPAERAYDATALSTHQDPDVEELAAIVEEIGEILTEDWASEDYERGFHDGRQSVMGDVHAVLNGTEPTLTMRQTFDLIWAADGMPDGNAIYAMLLEDRTAHYMWWRCVDWVLYRLRNGMPVKRANSDDDCPAEIDARFKAAQRTYADLGTGPSQSTATRRASHRQWMHGTARRRKKHSFVKRTN